MLDCIMSWVQPEKDGGSIYPESSQRHDSQSDA